MKTPPIFFNEISNTETIKISMITGRKLPLGKFLKTHVYDKDKSFLIRSKEYFTINCILTTIIHAFAHRKTYDQQFFFSMLQAEVFLLNWKIAFRIAREKRFSPLKKTKNISSEITMKTLDYV